MNPTLEELRQLVDVAMQRRPGSVLLKNARLVNVFTLEVEETNILLAGRWIAAVGKYLDQAKAEVVVDVEGDFVCPGLIDAHLHIESSLVLPGEYARAVVPRGVTGIVNDPHEVANVAGAPAIEWMLKASDGLPLEVWFTVSSSVPSTDNETSGAILDLDAIERLLQHPRVVGVAELMSFTRFLAGNASELTKVMLAESARKLPDGHAPGVRHQALQAYLSCGIASDHESTSFDEGKEKLASGCYLMIREGSATRNLEAQIELLDPKYGDRVGLVTDDRLPHDLLHEGGVDFAVRKAIALGANPAYAIRAASLNNARYFRLNRRGAIAPGYQADLIVLEDLNAFVAKRVYARGSQVAEHGRLSVTIPETVIDVAVLETTKIPQISIDSLTIPIQAQKIRAIQVIPDQILTREWIVSPTMRLGCVVADPDRDLAKLVCVERHGHHGSCTVGIANGFGLKTGALAGTIAHDHHNCMAVGVDDEDLLVAIQRIGELGGGLVAIRDRKVLAELALPLAGLLSDRPLNEVCVAMEKLNAAASSLGCTLSAPFMTLSFLGLAVIPELRLTDHGLVDIVANKVVPLAVN